MEWVLAGITLGTCVKDLAELGLEIKDSIDKVRQNEERLSQLRDEVAGTLDSLAKLTEGHKDARPSLELLTALEDLKRHLSQIQEKCQKQAKASQRTSKVVAGFKSWWKRDKIEVDIRQLNDCRKDCYNQFVLFSAARIENNTVQIAARIEDNATQIQVSELGQTLEKWLQYPPSMKKKQDDTQELHHEGTGDWFLAGPQFGDWKDKPGSLYIRGDSGTGKSVLSSIVIGELSNALHSAVQGTTAVAYFYFDFRDERSQRVKAMLQSIILQLSAQSSNPYSALKRQHKPSQGQIPPTYENLLRVLEELLLEFGHTYIVLDALDECNESDRLVQFVSRLHGWTKQSLHFLFTSQPREAFMNSKVFKEASLVLSPDITQGDIEQFVHSELHKLSHLKRRAGEIASTVVTKANGMFRLAACLLLELRDAFGSDLNAILLNLPDDLFGVYSRFLQRIHPTAVVYVSAVLRWLCFSSTPVTLLELEDALAFDFSDPNGEFVYDPTRRGENAARVCKMLEGMVTMSVDPIRRISSSPVSLAHASVADYLVSDKFAEKYTVYSFRAGPSHRFLAQTCLGYLLHFADHPFTETLPDYPLSLYAAENWYYHLSHCDNSALLSASAMRLLQNGSSQYAAFNDLRLSIRTKSTHPLQSLIFIPDKVLQPLSVCSEWGYTEGVRLLLQSGADPNMDDNGFTALEKASSGGHIDVVRLLLESGADVNTAVLRSASQNGHIEIIRLLFEKGTRVNASVISALEGASGGGHIDIVRILLEALGNIPASKIGCGNALYAASRNGYVKIVCLLLEHGAEVNAAGGEYNALYAASFNGHPEIVYLLLEHDAEVNATGGIYGSALQAACGATEPDGDVVHLLLYHGADINAAGGQYGSALQALCGSGWADSEDVDIVRLLLKHGANVNAAGGKYGGALQAVCGSGWRNTDVVRLLLEHGAEVNTAGGEYYSALYAASYHGCIDIVRLLLEHGAEVNATGGEYDSALYAASYNGHAETVRLLLEHGAEVNTAGGYYDSPLQAACRFARNADAVRLLLKHGGRINTASGISDSSLYIASYNGCTETVRLLLEHGVEVNVTGGRYGTALQAACGSREGNEDVVRLLIEHGAELNIVSSKCDSALYVASYYGYVEPVRLLLEHGAEVNAAGGYYGSPLQAACGSKWADADVVHLLLEHGADVNAAGREYDSALRLASEQGDIEIVRMLIEKGADVNAARGKCDSALYAASDNGHVEIVRLLVENGADVNAVGNFGSALQAASLWAKWANDSLEDYREIVEILLENGAHGENATSFGSSQTEIFEVEWI